MSGRTDPVGSSQRTEITEEAHKATWKERLGEIKGRSAKVVESKAFKGTLAGLGLFGGAALVTLGILAILNNHGAISVGVDFGHKIVTDVAAGSAIALGVGAAAVGTFAAVQLGRQIKRERDAQKNVDQINGMIEKELSDSEAARKREAAEKAVADQLGKVELTDEEEYKRYDQGQSNNVSAASRGFYKGTMFEGLANWLTRE